MQQKYAFLVQLWLQFEKKCYLCGRNYLSLPSFVEYTKAQAYLLYVVMIAWLIFDITHYIL